MVENEKSGFFFLNFAFYVIDLAELMLYKFGLLFRL